MGIDELFLQSLRYRFRELKKAGDRTLEQIDDADLHWQVNGEANSIAVIIQHLHGNMISRWTDFFTTDGDKPWRNRDAEFESKQLSKPEILKIWEEAWKLTLGAIDHLSGADLTRTITIRGQELDVTDACMRNVLHCASHVGQIVHIAKERLGSRWQTLSIPQGKSKEYKPKVKD